MRAGFAEADITPPIGTHKIGWIKDIVSERALDPLHARVAVFESDSGSIAFVQLDTLSVRWTTVSDIRARIEKAHGFPCGHVMVSATHNHAGPAVSNVGDAPRDEEYVETLTRKCVGAFGAALSNMQKAEIGFANVSDYGLSFNRRVVMRDGTVKTHGKPDDPDALYVEGPIDPEVAALAARRIGGGLLGCLVNFSCHPAHRGDGTDLSAGYPGVFAAEMKRRGCPTSLFLNGASGNISTRLDMDEVGRCLADDAVAALERMEFRRDVRLAAASETIELPYRRFTDDEIEGAVRGAQRFVD